MVTIGAGAERGPSLFFPARSRGGPNIEHKETPFRLTRLGAFLVFIDGAKARGYNFPNLRKGRQQYGTL